MMKEDIKTCSHLTNLKYDDWNKTKELHMNAVKTIKSYVDREKQSTDNQKSRQQPKAQQKGNYSESELLANLRMVKLYFHHILQDEIGRILSTVSKLNADCVDRSFTELQDEGFSDDGLFDKMKDSFVPLTIGDKCMDYDQQIKKSKQEQNDKLLKYQQLKEQTQRSGQSIVDIQRTWQKKDQVLVERILQYTNVRDEQIKTKLRYETH
ncbi:unnamed protein product, partial [Didymodactylos carnosus]